MKTQNYKNHIRWYPPHHFVFYPLVTVLLSVCLFYTFHDPLNRPLWLVLGASIMLMTYVSLMLRQHYALINQNRTVRLELRLRYYILTQKRFEVIENQLSRGQIYALRFACDEELVGLVDRALTENLTGDQIKKSIKKWLADDMRV